MIFNPLFYKPFHILLIYTFLITLTCKEAFSQTADDQWKFEDIPEWYDEFDQGNYPDSLKWTCQTGGQGWGNNELQYYTSRDNAYIKDGVLIITAKKEKKKKRDYTSARIITKHKGDWLYCRIEVKAKLPSGRGTWPAIWMLPTIQYYGKETSSGEIDIMEHVGYEKNIVHFSVHTKAYNSKFKNEKTKKLVVNKISDTFHIYRLDWTSYGIRGYVDGKKYFEYLNNGNGSKYWPFDKKFFLIINLAIGGDWGGLKGIDNSIFPANMEIDYVRVYRSLE